MGDAMKDQEFDEQELVRMEAAIQSMTPKERTNPTVIDASRRRRIAKGAGVDPKDVSALVKQYGMMKDMMKAMAGKNMLQRMRMGSQLSQMAAGGGMMPKFKSKASATKRVLSKKDKRKRRRK
jgi:signal recognition particle subunit SRP54